MPIRVRQKGDRRRITGPTLVRTRPGVKHEPPPIPLQGQIFRAVYAEAISDYESLSTASWSTGTTGGPTAEFNANCLYHHYTTANRNSVAVEHILAPIRWHMAMPSSDGGTYDRWLASRDNTGVGTVTLSDGRYQHTVNDGGSRPIAPVHTLLVSGSHAEFKEGFTRLYTLPPLLRMQVITGITVGPPTLAGISALPLWNASYVHVYAARHWVNGIATSAVVQPVPSDFWKLNVAEGDEYYCDIWYRIGSLPVANVSGPGKDCVYIPTTLVSNGSRMIRTQFASPLRWLPDLVFDNVDFTPSFNYHEQTYQLTLAGHSGWTLKSGSNGPHKMITLDGWTVRITASQITWTAPASHLYIDKIRLDWSTEIVYLYVFPRSGLVSHTGPLIYKPQSDGTYRSSTSCTGVGTISHAPMGRFAQSGTTTFDFVGWSNIPYTAANMDGTDEIPVSPPGSIPTSITVTRTTR